MRISVFQYKYIIIQNLLKVRQKFLLVNYIKNINYMIMKLFSINSFIVTRFLNATIEIDP